jgi:photosystem II stability/assembly factor-like uncharacterized protein
MRKLLARTIAASAIPVLLAALAAGASAQAASGRPASTRPASTRPASTRPASTRPESGRPTPPPGFEVDSASFVSARLGFVLGARHCSLLPCKARVESTTSGGRTWKKALPAPKVKLVPTYSAAPKSAVSSVLFANVSDGWLYGPGLWATTDSGLKWRRISLHGEVVALAASDGVAFAAVQSPTASFLTAKLYESKVGSARWTLVRKVEPENAITVSGHSVWVGIAGAESGVSGMWRSTDSGKHWTKLPFSCPAPDVSASPLAAASPSKVAIACSDQSYPLPGSSTKEVYTSANGGRTFHLAGKPPEPGNVLMLAMPPGEPKVITLEATSGATFLYRSTDGGKKWTEKEFFDAGLEIRDLAYVTAGAGYGVHFNGGPALAYGLGLLKTLNGGASWKTVATP